MRMNFNDPKTYSEKLQWLKVYYRNDLYYRLVDKREVRTFVSEKIGEQYLIPQYGVWSDVDDIPFSSLPNSFVLKCTHDSGGIVVCPDKSKLDISAAKRILKKGLNRRYYLNTREWPYSKVKPRIIVEEYRQDDEAKELKDYKFFCFNGEVKALFIATGRQSGDTRFDFYDSDFNHLPFTNGHENCTAEILKPAHFDLMKGLAEKLSEGMPHVRVDLYDSSEGVCFGEMTFFHWSGLMPFEPSIWDETFGNWLNLPEKNWDGSF